MSVDYSDIDAACAAAEREFEEIMIELATGITALLMEETPYDTGHARANWVPSIGSPFTTVDGVVRKLKSGKGKTTAGAAQKTGLSEVLSYALDQGDVYVSNNVPYILFLNYGKSSQAPANFVESCVQRGRDAVASRYGG